MNFLDIASDNLQLHCESIVAQKWRNVKGFYKYKYANRPTNALIFICDDNFQMKLTNTDGSFITISKGDLAFVPKSAMYSVEFINPPTSNNIIDSFTLNFLIKDSNGNDILLDDTICKLASDSFSQIESVINEMSRVFNDSNATKLRKQAKLYELFDTIISCMNDKADDYYPIRRGIRQLNKEWNKNEKISKYANLCAISEGYFHHLFKEWSGMSPVEYRNSLRIAQAKALLLNNSMSIKDIAAYVGYDDQFYFSRVFKSITGVSPQQYKKL